MIAITTIHWYYMFNQNLTPFTIIDYSPFNEFYYNFNQNNAIIIDHS